MKKLVKTIVSMVLLAASIAVAFQAGMVYHKYFVDTKAVEAVSQPEDGLDLKLPGETEKYVVTVDEVMEKLLTIGEVSSCEGSYTVTRGKDYTRYVLDNIPCLGTTNHVELTCSGVVKAGYKIEDIEVKVDDESRKIYISLPEVQLNSNQVFWDDTVICREENNILNPIDFPEYLELIEEIKTDGLLSAERDGLYVKAEESVKNIITNFLGCFDEYEVVFM